MRGKTLIQCFTPVFLVVLALGGAQARNNAAEYHAATMVSEAEAKATQKDVPHADNHQKVDPSQYVGADACKTCHEDVAKGYDHGPHWKTTLAKSLRDLLLRL